MSYGWGVGGTRRGLRSGNVDSFDRVRGNGVWTGLVGWDPETTTSGAWGTSWDMGHRMGHGDTD